MPKLISGGSLSLIDLKSELIRKQAALKSRQCISGSSSDCTNQVFVKNPNKKPFLFDERERQAREQKRSERRQKIESLERDLKLEENEVRMAKDRLIEKAKLYEACSGGGAGGSDFKETCLVDFERKRIEEAERKPQASNSITVGDDDDCYVSPGCSFTDVPDRIAREDGETLRPSAAEAETVCHNELASPLQHRELERTRWEMEVKEDIAAAESDLGPVHYQHVLRDEKWDHGVGYFKFSKDETARQQEMEYLENLRQQTLEQREKADKLKARRKAALGERLAKVRERKQLKAETSLDADPTALASIPLPPENSEDSEEKKAKMLEEQIAAKRRAAHIRPWDEGKRKILTQEEWIEKRRKERDPEFAPPSFNHY